MIKNFNKFRYVKDKHNNVWKYIPDKKHFLKVTPWENFEDRRVNCFEIEKRILKGELEQYTGKPKIYEIINKRWDDTESEWEYNGNIFFTERRGDNQNDCLKAPIHKFYHTYKTQDGKEHTYSNDYRIGYHNGNIVWFCFYHYYPQTIIIPFVSIDKEPEGMRTKWTKVCHIKPIYSVKNNGYI